MTSRLGENTNNRGTCYSLPNMALVRISPHPSPLRLSCSPRSSASRQETVWGSDPATGNSTVMDVQLSHLVRSTVTVICKSLLQLNMPTTSYHNEVKREQKQQKNLARGNTEVRGKVPTTITNIRTNRLIQ